MHYDTESIIGQELDAGERLVWSGVPRQGVVFQTSDIAMIPFSLLWGGFAIFWEFMAISTPNGKSDPAAMMFPLFGIPFVAIGLYMIFGRFIYDSMRRKKTLYGLTNERAIIISGVLKKEIKSLSLKTATDISLSEKSDKSGTITFGQDNRPAFMFSNSFPGAGTPLVPKFELIENAKNVYAELRAQQRS